MDFSRIKKIMRETGDKFIILENGEPELVVISFQEYERLSRSYLPPTAYLASGYHHEQNFMGGRGWKPMGRGKPERSEVRLADLNTQGFHETEFVAPLAEIPEMHHGATLVADEDIKNTFVEVCPVESRSGLYGVEIRGLPIRLEDIRLEDLPI